MSKYDEILTRMADVAARVDTFVGRIGVRKDADSRYPSDDDFRMAEEIERRGSSSSDKELGRKIKQQWQTRGTYSSASDLSELKKIYSQLGKK